MVVESQCIYKRQIKDHKAIRHLQMYTAQSGVWGVNLKGVNCNSVKSSQSSIEKHSEKN